MAFGPTKDKNDCICKTGACGKPQACGHLIFERLRSVPGRRCGRPIRSACHRASPAARHTRRNPDQVATTTDRHRSREAYGNYCRDRARPGHRANRAGRAPRGWAISIPSKRRTSGIEPGPETSLRRGPEAVRVPIKIVVAAILTCASSSYEGNLARVFREVG